MYVSVRTCSQESVYTTVDVCNNLNFAKSPLFMFIRFQKWWAWKFLWTLSALLLQSRMPVLLELGGSFIPSVHVKVSCKRWRRRKAATHVPCSCPCRVRRAMSKPNKGCCQDLGVWGALGSLPECLQGFRQLETSEDVGLETWIQILTLGYWPSLGFVRVKLGRKKEPFIHHAELFWRKFGITKM